jgi:choline-sulfatase
LFDLDNDPEETKDLSHLDKYMDIINELKLELYKICDPEEINKLAFKDQDKMIQSYGGIEVAGKLGATGATPPPK